MMSSIAVKDLAFHWPGQSDPTLDIGTFDLAADEAVFLRGPSGSGKSTLLSAVAGIVDVPKGTVTVANQDIGALSGGARDRFRVDHMGIVFQAFNLLPWLSPLENVQLPCRFSARRRNRAGDPAAAAQRLLPALGLADDRLMTGAAGDLSVGQQQRVAVARALIGAPEIVLADEPTSALDKAAKDAFIELLMRECAEAGAALLFVSHDRTLERYFDRVVDLPAINGTKGSC